MLGGGAQRDRVAARLATAGVETAPSALSPVGLVVNSGDPTVTEAWRDGEIYLQDVASQAAALVPPPAAAEVVADLAAAPGGKSFSLQASEPGVRIVAADRSLGRLQTMATNKNRLGLGLGLVQADVHAPPFRQEFDRVILDLPCTGSGTLRKHPELKWRIDEGEITRLSRQGTRALAAAADLVRAGGLLAVITCSLEPEENFEIVTSFQAEESDFESLDLEDRLVGGLRRGLIGPGRWQVLPGEEHDGFSVSVLQRRQ